MRTKRTLFLAIIVAAMAACEGPSDGPPAWFHEPPPPVEISQQASALSGVFGHQSFGSTSFGNNYTCSGPVCGCDNTIVAYSPDCEDMRANNCAGAALTCSPRIDKDGHVVGEICTCIKDCWNQPQDCTTVLGLTAPGFYTVNGGSPIYKRLNGNDRACQVTAAQWQQAGSIHPVNLTGTNADYMMAIYSGQTCSGVEAGAFTDTLGGEFYRSPNGSIYRKRGNNGMNAMRACSLTWDQYHTTLHDPAYVQMDAAGTADFQKRYGTGSGVDPITCVARDM